MASRTDVVDLLVPARIMKIPAGLLDPKVANLTPDDSVPILLVTRTVGQAVVAKAQVGRHPGF